MSIIYNIILLFFFFQAEDGIRDYKVTGVQTCALPISWMLLLPTSNRIGLREAEPGVWVGLRAHVSPTARLRPPCWLGANVHVGPGANIGPCAIVEDGVFVEEGSEISYTAIAPDTFVGKLTHLEHSLALGQTLIDWRDGSRLEVPDPFLLCSLREPRTAAS